MTANGAGASIDPHLLERLNSVGGPEDLRPSDAVLADLEELAVELERRSAAQTSELRTSDAWQLISRQREELLAGAGDALAFARAVADLRRDQPRPLPSAAHHAAELRFVPPDVHIPTGLRTLDTITDGGLLSGRLHVIAGEPDIGKTSLATQLAHVACEDGFVVGMHVADVDDRRGILQRIGQRHGVDRRAFLDRDPIAIEHVQAVVHRWHLAIVDEAEDNLTAADTAEALLVESRKTNRRAVMFVDSLQTVRLRWKDEPRTDKDRIDRVVRALHGYARKGLTIIATCEVPRSIYGGPKRRRKFDPGPPALAAFKGSGNIEYALWTGLVLTRIKDDVDAIRVEVPKNKQGRADVTFRLTRTESRVGYDDRGEIHEDTPAEQKPRPEGQDAFDARLERQATELLSQVVLKVVGAGERGASAKELRELIVGRNAAIDRATDLALQQGSIVSRRVRGFARFFVPSTAGST